MSSLVKQAKQIAVSGISRQAKKSELRQIISALINKADALDKHGISDDAISTQMLEVMECLKEVIMAENAALTSATLHHILSNIGVSPKRQDVVKHCVKKFKKVVA